MWSITRTKAGTQNKTNKRIKPSNPIRVWTINIRIKTNSKPDSDILAEDTNWKKDQSHHMCIMLIQEEEVHQNLPEPV